MHISESQQQDTIRKLYREQLTNEHFLQALQRTKNEFKLYIEIDE